MAGPHLSSRFAPWSFVIKNDNSKKAEKKYALAATADTRPR
jgi:hypothetical protein